MRFVELVVEEFVEEFSGLEFPSGSVSPVEFALEILPVSIASEFRCCATS